MEAWLNGDVKVCGLCGADSPRCNDPGNGTLYDTAKFCGGLWNETERVNALEKLGLLDTPQEEFFDSVTRMLMKMFSTQCSHLVLIDPSRCWFKSWQGRWCEFETSTDHGPNVECPREEGWCNYILVPSHAELLIIEDAQKDARLALNPFVVGPPHFRFYAGAPLVGSRGERYGTLCVADFVPRSFKAEQYALLCNFAALVVEELERNKALHAEVAESAMNYVERSRHLDLSLEASKEGLLMLDLRDSNWPILFGNPAMEKALNVKTDDLVGRNFWDLFECTQYSPLEIGISTGIGDMFRMDVVCKQTGRSTSLQMLPATSDRLAPSKATALPAWVPFEASPPLSSTVHERINDRSDEIVRSCKSFWFAVVCDDKTLTQQNLTAVVETGGGGGGYGGQTGAGYKMERRISVGSTGTSEAERSKLSSSLSGTWSSMFGEHPLPAKLNGVLELGPLLGGGSFGKAYRATTKDGAAVACKVMDCRRRDNNTIKQQMREIQLSASLIHPNVVSTIEYASSSDQPRTGKMIDVLWIVQELCDLGHLSSFIERGYLREEKKITSPANMPVTIATLLDIARGMAYVHQMSIIHADLTGRNVLVSSQERTEENPRGFSAKVADFGFARYAVSGRALPTQDIGTITHMPPELMDPDGGVLMPAADVWAFGIIAWEAFHGKCCYQGKNPGQIVITVFRGKTPDWTGDVPEDFGALIKRCFTYKHEGRPSFEELSEKLEAMLPSKD